VSAIAEDKQTSSKDSRKALTVKQLVLRCMIYPCLRGNRIEYVAECIDLDLTVHASTQHEAAESLRNAICGYLHVAFKGDITGLVPRPAPWSHRVRYHLFALRAALSIGVRSNFLLSDFAPETC
jgi:hypothetical protein